MREIKFRAWVRPGSVMQSFEPFFKAASKAPNPTSYPHLPWKSIDGWKWMQFTGLKDVHGSEIYEGDILGQMTHAEHLRRKPEYLKVVEWSGAGFNIRGGNFEVLGNIYENKELLNV